MNVRCSSGVPAFYKHLHMVQSEMLLSGDSGCHRPEAAQFQNEIISAYHSTATMQPQIAPGRPMTDVNFKGKIVR